MMTRRDSVAIARIMSRYISKASWYLAYNDYIRTTVVVSIVEDLADYMENDNPRFQRIRFIAACNGADDAKRNYIDTS